MRSEHSWSLLDPKPVLLYLPHHDDYIVFWNGVIMPHLMALSVTMEFLGIHPTPEMRTSMEQNYRRLYYAGAFNTREWDNQVDSSPVYQYLKKIMHEHITKLIEGKNPKDILDWFNYGRARTESLDKST